MLIICRSAAKITNINKKCMQLLCPVSVSCAYARVKIADTNKREGEREQGRRWAK